MAKKKSQLNEASSEVIEKNILEENPEGLPQTQDLPQIAIVPVMPEMQRFVFRNERDPGCALHFHYHTKTHRLHHYTLFDGKEHVLPVEVIDHLESLFIPIYGRKLNADGASEKCIVSQRYQFSCRNRRAA